MKSGERIPLPALSHEHRMASIGIKGIRDISILSLHEMLSIGVDSNLKKTYLAFQGICDTVMFWIHANIREPRLRPPHCFPMQLCESCSFEFVTDNSDFGREMSCEFSESSHREQKVLVGVHCVVLCR